MSLFKKDWSPEESDRWTIHDFLACVLGVLAYFFITIGIVGAFLLQVWGFVCVGVAGICLVVMYRVVDPKLRALSKAFEAKQDGYLESLERNIRWESKDGD